MLCSNIRLHASFSHEYSHEGVNRDIDNYLKEERWVQFLTERASESVTNIQNNNHSDNLEVSANCSTQNGHLKGDSQDDVKWMESVLIFIIFLSKLYFWFYILY